MRRRGVNKICLLHGAQTKPVGYETLTELNLSLHNLSVLNPSSGGGGLMRQKARVLTLIGILTSSAGGYSG